MFTEASSEMVFMDGGSQEAIFLKEGKWEEKA